MKLVVVPEAVESRAFMEDVLSEQDKVTKAAMSSPSGRNSSPVNESDDDDDEDPDDKDKRSLWIDTCKSPGQEASIIFLLSEGGLALPARTPSTCRPVAGSKTSPEPTATNV